MGISVPMSYVPASVAELTLVMIGGVSMTILRIAKPSVLTGGNVGSASVSTASRSVLPSGSVNAVVLV